MDYKEEFISKTKERYAEAVNAKNVRENAKRILDGFFASLQEELKAEIDASRGTIDIRIDPKKYAVVIEGSYLEIANHGDIINVTVPRPGIYFTDKLEFTTEGYYSKRFDAYLGNDLLNQYLKETFDKAF